MRWDRSTVHRDESVSTRRETKEEAKREKHAHETKPAKYCLYASCNVSRGLMVATVVLSRVSEPTERIISVGCIASVDAINRLM